MSEEIVQEEMVAISRYEYETLIRSNLKLSAYERYGVDNWSGHDEAMKFYRKLLEEEEL